MTVEAPDGAFLDLCQYVRPTEAGVGHCRDVVFSQIRVVVVKRQSHWISFPAGTRMRPFILPDLSLEHFTAIVSVFGVPLLVLLVIRLVPSLLSFFAISCDSFHRRPYA